MITNSAYVVDTGMAIALGILLSKAVSTHAHWWWKSILRAHRERHGVETPTGETPGR